MNKCVPLEVIKQFGNEFPGIYNRCEDVDGDVSFTMRDLQTIQSHGSNVQDYWSTVEVIKTCHVWRKFKQEYQFDPDLEEMILEQESLMDSKLPMKVLESVPFQSVFVKTSRFAVNGLNDFAGFFATVHKSQDKNRLFFAPVYVSGNVCGILGLELEDRPLGETIKKTFDNYQTTLKDNGVEDDKVTDEDYYGQMCDMMNQMLQLLLYICSANMEKEADPEHEKMYRPAKGKIRDQYKEVKIWNVGKDTGAIIRNMKHSTGSRHSVAHTGSHTPKRTHIRKGHYHHYWRGPRTGERQIVLNWVAPTIINGASEDIPLTNRVEGKL